MYQCNKLDFEKEKDILGLQRWEKNWGLDEVMCLKSGD